MAWIDDFTKQYLSGGADDSAPSEDYSESNTSAANDYSDDYSYTQEQNDNSNNSWLDSFTQQYLSDNSYSEQEQQGGNLQEAVEQTVQGEAAPQAQNANLQDALTQVTGQQPQAEQPKQGIFDKPEIKTTPERDALIEEYNNLGNPNYLHTKAERDAYIQKHDELLGRLREIDEELGNGAMDYNFRDRLQSVLGGSIKGYGADMMNAGATVLSGFNELGEKLGGDTGQYAGWATDEVSRAAIPQENNPDAYAQQRQEVANMQAKSDELAQESAADIERAKNGQSKFEQFGTDIATNAIQMGMDALAAGLTGGSSLALMFVRSAGGGAREAREDDASVAQQIAYGTVRGGIEVFTEKMFDGLAKIYGAGLADEAVEKLIGKLGQGNKLVQSGLRWMFSGLGEAVEEGASGLSEPLTKMIYQGAEALKEYKDPEYWAENMYGMLVGYAMGGAGGAVNLVNGENRRANAEIQEGIDQRNEIKNNLIENNGMSEEDATKASEILAKIANGEKISQKQKAFLDTLQEANGIDTSKPNVPTAQAEAQTQQTSAQQTEAPQAETPSTPQVAEEPSAPIAQTQEETVSLAEQKAQAEEELRQAQEAYDAAENDPEMQPSLLEAVEQVQQKLDKINSEMQGESTDISEEQPQPTQESDGKETADTTEQENNGENWSGPEVKTQSTFHRQLTEEEKARADLNPENDTHTQHHDTEVDTFANNRITERGHEGAREDLMSRNPAEWDDVDVRTAQMLLSEELENARNLEGEAQDAAYKRIAQLKNAYNQQGTEDARALRQRSRFGGSKAEIVSEAANILYGDENAKKLRKVSPEQKAEIMRQIDEYSTELENTERGDVSSIKDIIMQVAQIRNTHANLDTNQIRLGKVIDAVAKTEGGEDFLRQLATTQIRSIASDQIKPTFWDKAKAVRYMFMLSNPATASRNVGANTVFGNIVDAISANMSSPIDALMSMATGNKTVGTERLSKEGLQGSIEAGLKSWLEVSLDAEAEQSSYAYNEIKGRTFKANGNFIERFMSALERNQGYQLKTTDQIAKGGIEAETKRNLIKQGVDPDKAAELAKEEAKYRTLQNESGISKAAQNLRKGLNDLFSIKGKDGKPVYGLGEDILPFAQVPANVVKTELDLNPLSIFKATAQVANVMTKGQNATAQEQRAAAKAFGQAVNGTAIVALAALASAKGIIRYTDDEDKDQKQLHKAQGKSGLQLNASALGRLFSFGNPSTQEGDKWISLGWMPQLNSLLIIGNMVYDDYKDMPEHKDLADWAKFVGDVGLDSLQGMYESILEFPAVSTITSMINAAKYAEIPEDATKEEATAIKAGAILADKAANTITSFTVPNAMRAVAAGLDDTERNLYGAETRVGQAIDSIKAGIPDNPLIPKKYTRGSLPALTDNLGNPFKNEGGANQFLNKVVYPGAVTTDKDLPVLDAIDKVATATGKMDAIPKKNGAYSVTYGDEKFKLTNEEREAWHEFAGERIEKYTGELINSKYYSLMTDEQKAEAMIKINEQAYSEADKNFLSSKGIETTNKLLDGVEKPGDTAKDKTALDESNVTSYFAFKTMFDSNLKDGEYKNADQIAKWYNGLNENLKTVLNERDTDLKRVLEFQKVGLSSETYAKVKAVIPNVQEELDASSETSSYVRLYGLANADIPEKERVTIVEKLVQGSKGFISKNAQAAWTALKPYGFTVEQTAQFFDIALHCATFKDTNTAKDFKGKLTPENTAFALQQVSWLNDAQRTAIYNTIKAESDNDYKVNDWGNYTYASEVKWFTNSKNKATYHTNVSITPSGQKALLGSAS